VRDDLGAPPFLAEQPLEQIGGADRPAMAEREAQVRDAGPRWFRLSGEGAPQPFFRQT